MSDKLTDAEIKELRAKKQAIKEELYDKVKMEMSEKEPLDGLTKLSQMMEESRVQYEAENDSWWDNLTEKEREDAFYAVCKRIHKAEIEDQGTYRWALYDVFGFNEGMYRKGMDCGFMDIHNSIIDEEQKVILREHQRKQKQ